MIFTSACRNIASLMSCILFSRVAAETLFSQYLLYERVDSVFVLHCYHKLIPNYNEDMHGNMSRKRATFNEQNHRGRDLITINAGHSSVINSQKQYLTANKYFQFWTFFIIIFN